MSTCRVAAFARTRLRIHSPSFAVLAIRCLLVRIPVHKPTLPRTAEPNSRHRAGFHVNVTPFLLATAQQSDALRDQTYSENECACVS